MTVTTSLFSDIAKTAAPLPLGPSRGDLCVDLLFLVCRFQVAELAHRDENPIYIIEG